jgi:hypothetical protein
MSDKENAVPEPGHIKNMGMLDLRSAKTAEDLRHIKAISEVGCILIPEHLTASLSHIAMKNVGNIVGIPEGENIKMHIGQQKLSGEALAAGNPEDILFIVGQLFLTSVVESVGYKEIWVNGQVIALRGSETALGGKLGRLTGQIMYLPAKARIIMGNETIDREFLELLPEPRAFVVMGRLEFAADVTADLIKSKIPEIVLMGCICAPAPLLSLIKVLTPEKMGEILATEECRAQETAKTEAEPDGD